MAIEAVVFDVGETLVDETRVWSGWADRLGIPRFTFLAVVGATIARGADHREVFRILRPDFDVDAAIRQSEDVAAPATVTREDLYPDAEPCLAALHAAGYRLGIVGNQPARTEAVFGALDVPVELVASSGTWGVEKPDPAFFARIAAELALPPAAIAYVGDRVDNDVAPASAAGFASVFIRRGPWAWIQAGRERPRGAALVVESLTELPAAVAALRGQTSASTV